jgi:hypothetical protein
MLHIVLSRSSIHLANAFAASGRPLSGRTQASTPATRTVTPRVVPENIIAHAHSLARKPVSAPSGESFQGHGHKHKGRIIKAAAKHVNALQYFQPYAAGSGTSGTDTDGEGAPADSLFLVPFSSSFCRIVLWQACCLFKRRRGAAASCYFVAPSVSSKRPRRSSHFCKVPSTCFSAHRHALVTRYERSRGFHLGSIRYWTFGSSI